MLLRKLLVLSGVVAAVGTASAQLTSPDCQDDVFYQFMPIAWRDSNNDTYRYGDFGGMTASLDYLQEIGVTAVWMNPIFPSPAYHGYQHGPADQVNSWFGTEAQFLDFVGQAHAHGIKVFVDLVCYGINQNTSYYLNAFNDPNDPYDTWLAFTNTQNTTYQGYTYHTWTGANVGFINWDLRTPAVKNLVINWSKHWLDPDNDGDPSDGIDGYRLDHVWVQYGYGPDGWGYNIDDFWTPWKAALQTVNPDVFTFAEQADWDSYGTGLLVAHDATFTKPFLFAARDALSNESAANLYSSMAATIAAVPAGRTFMGELGDHDVDRLTSVLGSSMSKAKVAAAVLLTQPFPPIIYFGDEIGMLGVKASYGSDADDIPFREPFKWLAVAGPPMSNYFAQHTSAYNSRYSRDNDGRSVPEQDGVTGSLLEEYKKLIAARHAHIALRRGTYVPITNSSSRVWAFLRQSTSGETLLVAINVYSASRTTSLDLSQEQIPGGSTTPLDILDGSTLPAITDANKGAYSLTLPAYGYRVLAVNLIPAPPPVSYVDGLSIPDMGGAPGLVATQDNATGLGDNVSELDQLYARGRRNAVEVGLTGNLATDGTALALFFDTAAGGQNVLNTANVGSLPGGVAELNGLQFDADFAPDYLLWINTASGTVYVDQFTLPTTGDPVKTYRGQGTIGSGSGLLSGGTNPNGLQVAMDNTNTAGVTDQSAAEAATATTGFELWIPWADIGLPTTGGQSVGLAAFIVQSRGAVSNQWLPGLGGGYANLGLTPNLTAVPGLQFATVVVAGAGDMNCDGVISYADINPFVLAITNAASYEAQFPECDFLNADCTSDGQVSYADINAFVQLLSNL